MTALRHGLIALGLAACLAPASGRAEEGSEQDSGFGIKPYIQYEAGATFMRNQAVVRHGDANLRGDVHPETAGYDVGGALGARFLEHFRGEVHLGYRNNKIDRAHINSGVANAQKDGSGNVSMLDLLFNAYADYDFELGDFVVSPYFGLGIGYGLARLDAENTKTGDFQVDDTDNAFLWNVMSGVGIPVSDVTTLNIGYRYLMSESLRFSASKVGALVGKRQIASEYDAHELVIGLRYSF